MTKEQRSDEDFLTRLRCHKHKWGPVHQIKCDLCNSSKSKYVVIMRMIRTYCGMLVVNQSTLMLRFAARNARNTCVGLVIAVLTTMAHLLTT